MWFLLRGFMIDAVVLLSVSILLGGMTVFSFVIAPLIFVKLPLETASGFIRAIFPWYYLFVLASAGVAAAALIARDARLAIAMAAVCAGAALAREVLMPAINRSRDASLAGDAAAARRFQALHSTSVVINFVQLIAAGAVLLLFAL